MEYEHTQPGNFIRYAMLGMAILWAIAIYFDPDGTLGPILFAYAVLSLITTLFWTMTIRCTTTHLEHSFHLGFWTRKYPIEDIKAVETSNKAWYNGYGIRLTQEGWLYNVSGSAIVKVHFHNGRTIWLGTDDQESLYRVLSEKIH